MKRLAEFFRRQAACRPLAMFSVSFFLGIIACRENNIPLFVPILAVAAAVVLRIALYLKHKRLWILPLLIAFLLGNIRMLSEFDLRPPVPEMFSIEFEGDVVSDPIYKEDTERIICALRLDHINHEPAHSTVRLYLRSKELELTGIEYGQHLTATGHVWPQDEPTNPYEPNRRMMLFTDGFAGMAAAKLEDVQIEEAPQSLGKLRVSLIHAISNRIDRLFPRNAALAKAFILGDRSHLNTSLRQNFNKIGVAHLICISGMHISVLAMFISNLLQRFLSKKASFFAALSGILLYGMLIGFSPSLLRATIMFAVYAYAPIAGRYSDPFTRIALALLITLLWSPFNIFDAGFLLSYSASLGIILLVQPLENLFGIAQLKSSRRFKKKFRRPVRKLLLYFPEILCTTLAAQLASMPLLVAAFGAQSLVSVPANMLTIPIAMIAYPIGLAGLAISAVFFPIGACISWISDMAFSAMVSVIGAFASIPNALVHIPDYPSWLFIIHIVLMFMASGLNYISVSRRRWIPLGLVVLIGVSMLNCWVHTLGFTAVFLDAGQADAAVIRSEGKVHVIDVGKAYSPLPDYASASCLTIDSVFLSHPHYDHAGGLASLIYRLEPKTIYIPNGWFDVEVSDTVREGMELAKERNIEIIELTAGDEIQLSENLHVKILSPTETFGSVNDMSLLMDVSYKDTHLLYTGDLTIEGEPDDFPDADILKVPHHGSNNACSENMLECTTPSISVICVGENRYGHPHDETLARLKESDSEIYRTDQAGAITVKVDRNGKLHTKTFFSVEDYQ